MKELVFLEYTFMFSPGEAWPHLHQFESALADFFSAHGLEAEVVKTVNGQIGRRILLLKKIEDVIPTIDKPKETKPTSVKSHIDSLRNKEYK